MASSGRVKPSPALRRSAISSSEGRNSSARFRSPERSSARITDAFSLEPLLRLELAGADRLALQVIVAQHQRRDLVGHLHQQPVARRAA